MKSTDRVLFAYTYPFNLQDIEYSIQEVQQKCLTHEDVYFKKKQIAESVEGRPVH